MKVFTLPKEVSKVLCSVCGSEKRNFYFKHLWVGDGAVAPHNGKEVGFGPFVAAAQRTWFESLTTKIDLIGVRMFENLTANGNMLMKIKKS